MTGIDQYTAYFKNLAIQHVILAHEEVDGKKAFVRSNIEELYSGFRTTLNSTGYIMRLISPEWKIVDNKSGNPMKRIEGSLFITGYHREEEYDEQQTAMDTSEQIVESIINRMTKDAKEELISENAIFYKSLNTLDNINVYPIENLEENRSGWQLTFHISPFYNICTKPDDWKDIIE